jgi:hypothetical protein
MKHYLYSLLAACLLTVFFTGNTSAKRVVVPKMYMFGFAASFSDTIVYFTDIQAVDSAWIDKKSGFLQSRDIYSSQLHSFLSRTKQMPHRTCVVFYDKKREKLEKKFVKIRRQYSKGKDGQEHFDVRFLEAGEFKFRSMNLTGLDEAEQQLATENEQAEKDAQKDVKNKKGKDKKQKKARKRSDN